MSTPNKPHGTLLGASISWHVLCSERTKSNATLQSEPLKQKHNRKQSWVKKGGLYLLCLLTHSCWAKHHNLHVVRNFCTSPLPSYVPNESVIKSATVGLQTLVFPTIAPNLQLQYSYSTTKVYLNSGSQSTLVIGLNGSGRKTKVGNFCKVKP